MICVLKSVFSVFFFFGNLDKFLRKIPPTAGRAHLSTTNVVARSPRKICSRSMKEFLKKMICLNELIMKKSPKNHFLRNAQIAFGSL